MGGLETDIIDLVGCFTVLENSIAEESKKNDVLMTFIQEINEALSEEKYHIALQLTDELEEFMDMEFCDS